MKRPTGKWPFQETARAKTLLQKGAGSIPVAAPPWVEMRLKTRLCVLPVRHGKRDTQFRG